LSKGIAPKPAEEQLLALIAADAWRMAYLQAVASLALPDCWIGAGFVRAPVWDRLHGFSRPTPLNDIDVIYFDPDKLDPETDYALEARLTELMPGEPWSVRNQARMHLRNNDRPYSSTEDALRHWLETPTAVAVRRGEAGMLELLAPLGLDDLMGLIVRPTPHARAHRLTDYRARAAAKNWPAKWPQVQILHA